MEWFIAALGGAAFSLVAAAIVLLLYRRLRASQSKKQHVAREIYSPASPHSTSNTIQPVLSPRDALPPGDAESMSPIGDEDVRIACSPANTPGRDVSTPVRSQAAWLESMISSSSCAALPTRRPRNLSNDMGASSSVTASDVSAQSAAAEVAEPLAFTHVTAAISSGVLPESTLSSPSRASPSQRADSSFHDLSSSSEDEAEAAADAAHRFNGSSDPRRSVPDAFITQLAQSNIGSSGAESPLSSQSPGSLGESQVDMQARAEEGRIAVEPQQMDEDVSIIVDNVLRQVRLRSSDG